MEFTIDFVWIDSLRPTNNLSVIKGPVFLGWTSTKLGSMFLLKDAMQWRLWGSNPRPLSLESSNLPLSLVTALSKIYHFYICNLPLIIEFTLKMEFILEYRIYPAICKLPSIYKLPLNMVVTLKDGIYHWIWN